MDVHVRHLRYFVMVAELQHFTRAAERLHVSQPALSKQIRALEGMIGAPLFDRERRDVRPTAVGIALLPHARRLLAEWDLARDAVDRVRSAQQSTLVVGMSTSPGRGGLLPAIRSRFTDLHPTATVALRQVGWEDSTAGLADRTSDVAFVWLPLPDPGRYRWRVLLEEPCLVAMPEHHPLASRRTVEFADLVDEPFLALPESAGPLRDHWLGVALRHGEPPTIGAEISSVDETYEALVGGQGICLLASGNAPSLTRGGVVTRAVSGVPPCRLAIAWRNDESHPLARAYIECAGQVAVSAATSTPDADRSPTS